MDEAKQSKVKRARWDPFWHGWKLGTVWQGGDGEPKTTELIELATYRVLRTTDGWLGGSDDDSDGGWLTEAYKLDAEMASKAFRAEDYPQRRERLPDDEHYMVWSGRRVHAKARLAGDDGNGLTDVIDTQTGRVVRSDPGICGRMMMRSSTETADRAAWLDMVRRLDCEMAGIEYRIEDYVYGLRVGDTVSVYWQLRDYLADMPQMRGTVTAIRGDTAYVATDDPWGWWRDEDDQTPECPCPVAHCLPDRLAVPTDERTKGDGCAWRLDDSTGVRLDSDLAKVLRWLGYEVWYDAEESWKWETCDLCVAREPGARRAGEYVATIRYDGTFPRVTKERRAAFEYLVAEARLHAARNDPPPEGGDLPPGEGGGTMGLYVNGELRKG